jgi:hypothetical protein
MTVNLIEKLLDLKKEKATGIPVIRIIINILAGEIINYPDVTHLPER